MSATPNIVPTVRRELPQTLLAKNLTVARIAAGMTQHALASAADISRATIAQLETGCGDPRLSTVAALAAALQIPPYVLLVGLRDVASLLELPGKLVDPPFNIEPIELREMNHFVRSGMLKDRVRAGRLGAEIAQRANIFSPAALAVAAIFSAISPGAGTFAGAALGESSAKEAG